MSAVLPLSILSTLPDSAPSASRFVAPPGGPRWLAARWLLALLLGLLSGTAALAQTTTTPDCSQDEKFINQWYFGYKAGLDFNQATDSIPPTVLTNSQMTAPAGSGVMSDGSGNLLFYSNGDTIWSRNHTVMLNGTGMGGNRLCTDGPLAIRLPGSPTTTGGPTTYLIFTQDAQGGPKGLSYSEILINPGQQGEVVAATKNTPLTTGTTEKMTGVLHKNGCDVWIIVHGWGTATSGTANRGDSFLAYRVTPAGVQTTPIISTIGAVHAASVSPQGYRGQMKVSPDGQQLAVARYSTLPDSTGSVELFAFDAATGIVSNRRVVDSGAGRYYGVEFSPGRSRLYATVMTQPQLLQFDLTATNIPGSRQVLPLKQTTPVNLGSMQAGPDGKIYVARENQPALGFIAHPDSLGVAARYADDSLQLGTRRSGLGLPNFNQSSLLRVGFGGQPTACYEITFQAGSPIPNPQSYAWNFGDPGSGAANTSAAANPVHTYPGPGDYTVTLRITNFCFCREVQGIIRVYGPPTPGSIGAAQALCAGGVPAPLTSTAAAGAGTGQFIYQWQSSPDNTTWTDISGANAPGYAPGALSVTTYYRRLVTSGFCSPRTPTASVAITVTPALVPGSIAAAQTICAGTTPAPLTSASAATGGTGAYAYQWESSPDNVTFTAIGGAVGADYVPGALTATTYFRRQASSGPCTNVPSNVLAITVVPALTAGSIAADQTLCGGTTPAPLTSTTAAAGGAGSISYQWESSADNVTFTAIGGATGATYAPGTLAATTYFRRTASAGSACAPAVSNVVTITLLPVLTAGSIGADQTLCGPATPARLTSTAAASGGTGTLSYQWESSADNVTFTAINGATSADYSPGPLTATTYFRRAVTSGSCGTQYTAVVTLTVVPTVVAGSIGADQTLCGPATPTPLSSIAPATAGSGNISYQWESSADNVTFTAIGGATGATYAPSTLAATTYFRRTASVSSACPPVASNVVTITVVPTLVAGSISADQTVCPGIAPAALTGPAATGGANTLSYQWESSADNVTFTAIGGATGTTYSPGTLTATTYFRRRVSSGVCGPVYTNTVAITVVPALTPGTIAADQDVCAGATPTPLSSTSAASGGTGTYAYQWESSPDNSTWTAIGGATGATYAPGPLTATTYFRRRATSGTGSCSTDVSNVVAVRVQPLVTPTVSVAPPPVQCPGTPLTFTAVTTNVGAAPTFQWFVNGTAVASGPTFTSSTLATGDQVRVEVTPTAGLCSTGSATATVAVTRTVAPAPALTIDVQPSGAVCPGEPLTFSIANVTNAGANPTYQWQVNGNNVAGATTPVFTSTTLRDGQTVTLRLSTVDACGQTVTATSNGINARINPPVNVDAGPDKEILAGSSVTLEGSSNGTPVAWTPSIGLTFPGNDPLHPLAAPTVTTTYTLTAGSGGCTNSDQVTVTVRPAIRIFNAFSPNGDGVDDTWQIDFIEEYPDNSVIVFNRWGNKIFSTTGYNRSNEWNGTINGQPAPIGTYYYIVVTKGPLGRSYSGSVTVVY